MSTQNVFKRYELKYMLTSQQYKALRLAMAQHMELDAYGKHTIQNVYFDTPDYLLIRRSLEKPAYKEKLRIRSYGEATGKSAVFVELKKKFDGVVYKRRMALPLKQAYDFLMRGVPVQQDKQIANEISYFMKHYQTLAPMVGIDYEREAFFGREDGDFRMTFDHNIRMSDYNAPATEGSHLVLEGDTVLLEVKTAMGLPQWLVEFFSANQIYKGSFSKYGTAYQKFLLGDQQKKKEEAAHVA